MKEVINIPERQIKELAGRVNGDTRSMGMTLTSCAPPEPGETIFRIGKDEMETGMGIQIESGVEREKIESTGRIVDEMLRKILGGTVDFTNPGSDIAVMVSGLAARRSCNSTSPTPAWPTC